jgi:IPT/TIG domain
LFLIAARWHPTCFNLVKFNLAPGSGVCEIFKGLNGDPVPEGVIPMISRNRALSLAVLLALFFVAGCNNTLNPLCGSARPMPVIGSLSPSTVSFVQVQQGLMLTVNGSDFVSSSEVVINSTPLSATVVSDDQLKVKLTTDVISASGLVKVSVETPSGNSGDLDCTSGGQSSALILTVN